MVQRNTNQHNKVIFEKPTANIIMDREKLKTPQTSIKTNKFSEFVEYKIDIKVSGISIY